MSDKPAAPAPDFLDGLAELWRDCAACFREIAAATAERRGLPESVRIEQSAVAARRLARNLDRVADLLEGRGRGTGRGERLAVRPLAPPFRRWRVRDRV